MAICTLCKKKYNKEKQHKIFLTLHKKNLNLYAMHDICSSCIKESLSAKKERLYSMLKRSKSEMDLKRIEYHQALNNHNKLKYRYETLDRQVADITFFSNKEKHTLPPKKAPKKRIKKLTLQIEAILSSMPPEQRNLYKEKLFALQKITNKNEYKKLKLAVQ